jgi:hypothetical protein
MTGEESLPFLVGGATTDITPPLEAGILMSAAQRKWAPFAGVRSPLRARALALADGGRRVALVSLDLLGISGKAFGGGARFKARIVAVAKRAVRPADLVLTATHTHAAPETLGLTDLCRTRPFTRWVGDLAERIGDAVGRAAERMEPCRLRAASIEAPGLAIHRRIKTTRGVVLSSPEPPPEAVLSRAGATDPTVNVAAFTGRTGELVALLVNACCHPVHEMCLPLVSSDYPGEMCSALERRHPGATVLFFNGAAGNINPPTVSGGPADAQAHGQKLAAVVEEAFARAADTPVGRQATGRSSLPEERSAQGMILLGRRRVLLPGRTLAGRPSKVPVRTEIAGLRLGSLLFIFIPGELFVEIGLAIRKAPLFATTWIVGYAEDYIGYIPTRAAFDEGGYELGPGAWARVGRGAQAILLREARALLRSLKAAPAPRACGRT